MLAPRYPSIQAATAQPLGGCSINRKNKENNEGQQEVISDGGNTKSCIGAGKSANSFVAMGRAFTKRQLGKKEACEQKMDNKT